MALFFIAETPNKSVSFILLPRNYTIIYNKLKTYFTGSGIFFLARPDVKADYTNWSVEADTQINRADILDYNQLDNEEKDIVVDQVETLKDNITARLLKEPELSSIVADLFIIPALNSIKVIKKGHELHPVLTQWGCRYNNIPNKINPLSELIGETATTTAKVLLEFYYTDGAKAAGKTFYASYLGRQTQAKADKDGLYNRGRLKLDSVLTVFDIVNDVKSYIHTFTITPNAKYVVTFPYITSATIKVVDQLGELLLNKDILISYQGAETAYNTGQTGIVALNYIECGKTITAIESGNTKNTQTYTLSREHNDFTFVCNRTLYADATIKVIDGNNNLQKHYKVLVDYDGQQKEYSTLEEGIIKLDRLQAGKEIKITDLNKIDNFIIGSIQLENNEFIINITREAPKFVKVRLVDHRNKPMPATLIAFEHNGKKREEITDADGYCTMPFEDFVDGKKVNAVINLPKKQKKLKK